MSTQIASRSISPLQQYQFLDKYARWNYEHGRRETWEESVQRAVDFLDELSGYRSDMTRDLKEIKQAMLNMEVFPSMRLFAMAGEAARRNSLAIYNCSYLPVDSIHSFVEALMLSMSGCGVGFSVEKHNVNKLPSIPYQTGLRTSFIVPDTTEGWAEGLYFVFKALYKGKLPEIDYSEIRPAGSVLRVKGGRASGPEPYKKAINFIIQTFLENQGSKLKPIQCHDIMCMIASCAISGGVRRSAMLSLFDHDDSEMMDAKSGEWWIDHPNRAYANNSSVLDSDNFHFSDSEALVRTIDRNKSGEPGIFFRNNAQDWSDNYERDGDHLFGTNPCGEINLRPMQLCNLSQVIARPEDTVNDLQRKVRLAVIIGTIQSMATNFPTLMRPEWYYNAIEERLLGVDITGQMDAFDMLSDINMGAMRDYAIRINHIYAQKLGINPSASVTCVKPSGNSSVLFNASPGIHGRWAPYYIRRVRVNANAPMKKLLELSGFNLVPDVGEDLHNPSKYVVEFPVKSPKGAKTQQDLTAKEQLDWWLKNKKEWTTHNPSATITYEQHELAFIATWLALHKYYVGGLTFLPKSNHTYALAPYEAISEERYLAMVDETPEINFDLLFEVEKEDMTTAAQELACFAGNCD